MKEGTWDWAKKVMLEGYMVRSKSWSINVNLKLRARPGTNVLEIHSFLNDDGKWEPAPTSLEQDLYSTTTDYEICEWSDGQRSENISNIFFNSVPNIFHSN